MFELIRQNQRRTFVLIAAMGMLLLFVGWAFGALYLGRGDVGVALAAVLWVMLTAISYFRGEKIILSISRARKIEKGDHPTLHNVVEEMAIASGLGRMPAIYLIDDPSPNAFAAGRDTEHAVVAVTSGLLEALTRDELQGVIGHELGHIRNRDVLYMTMLAVMLGSIVLIADIGRRHMLWGGSTRSRRSSRDGGGGQIILMVVALVLIILAPIAAHLIYLAVSRRREYLADASGAIYTRHPDALASALEKIGSSPDRLKVANPATAGMYFVNPLEKGKVALSAMGSTHPPITERVKILRSLGRGPGFAEYARSFQLVTGRPVGVRSTAGMVEPSATQAVPKRVIATPTLPPLPTDAFPIDPVLGAAALAHTERVRETTDALWKTDGYRFIECPCETRLKIPPALSDRDITCPHCQRMHPPVEPGSELEN